MRPEPDVAQSACRPASSFPWAEAVLGCAYWHRVEDAPLRFWSGSPTRNPRVSSQERAALARWRHETIDHLLGVIGNSISLEYSRMRRLSREGLAAVEQHDPCHLVRASPGAVDKAQKYMLEWLGPGREVDLPARASRTQDLLIPGPGG